MAFVPGYGHEGNASEGEPLVIPPVFDQARQAG
jgi:hypothetical protein